MAIETQQTSEVPPNSDEGSASAPKPLRRACDCCRKRKVKCDGGNPCGPCDKASIRCAYLQPPKKKGPKGLRSARVLHDLRRIGENASASPTSPLSPEQQFSKWGWTAPGGSPNGVNYSPPLVQQPPDVVYGPHTSMAPDQSYFQEMPTSFPHPQQQPQYATLPMQYDMGLHSQGWSAKSESVSGGSDVPSIMTPTTPEPIQLRLSGDTFLPYIRLFFRHLFPIFPVIDRNTYLDPTFYSDTNLWSFEMYCFICAICAATVGQLQNSIQQPSAINPVKRMDDVFIEECLRERKKYDYIESVSTFNVMAAFFLFCAYGNQENSIKAWYYLQESITIAENLNMDDEASYSNDKFQSNPMESQWRRRLYWLLFITERAYAMQRRKHARLQATVDLPCIMEGEDDEMFNGGSVLTGFAVLGRLFAAVSNEFMQVWHGTRKRSLCNEAWLAHTQKKLDAAVLTIDGISDTQRVDISVTREWLHMLAWQMGVKNGLMFGNGEGGMTIDYPIELAQNVVAITSGATAISLDSHGIGMEQKLSDIAGCVADVLGISNDTAPRYQEGQEYLKILLGRLSSIRGTQSRYLERVVSKIQRTQPGWGYELNNQTLPLPIESPGIYYPTQFNEYLGTPRLSIQDPLRMLRALSVSGNLGMPSLSDSQEWSRRPSGKVYDEAETDAMDQWMLNGAIVQPVS